MPPGPVLQAINTRLHVEPLASIFHTVYWSIALLLAFPFCVLILSGRCAWKLLVRYSLRPDEVDYYVPSIYNKERSTSHQCELAVLVTGCDTGFGKEVALLAAAKGFVVFAGCLQKESFGQFKDMNNVQPLLLDVTNDDHVTKAVTVVEEWIRVGDKETPKKQRVLHAILNNAGIGIGGLVDWLNLAAFQKVMDVNYFGIIRICQAFLPLLKDQAIRRTHIGARILNVVSMAGLVPSGSGLGTYGPSKFAATAFSTVLRHELKAFGIQVATINPSFHGTPIVSQMRSDMTRTWETLDDNKRAQYGDEFFDRFVKLGVDIPEAFSWKLENVVDTVIIALQARHVEPEMLVGMDARFGLAALRMLPAWLIDWLDSLFGRPKPAVMQGK